MAIYRLNSKIQNYAWGSLRKLSQLLGRAPSGLPEAELWMGAHPACPSGVVGDAGGASNLRQLIEREPQLAGGRLPYLFKVLSAQQSLSLQCHPNAVQAERGFARENELGIALDAPGRNYKDPRHKPELLMALTDFVAFCGFLPYERAIARFQHYRIGELLPAFRAFERAPDEHTLAELFASLFDLSQAERERAIRRVVGRARLDVEDKNSRSQLGEWLIKIEEQYGSDPGVLASILLHFVQLRPGEALFLPSGVLHSYAYGTGLEIMAASDNVLRGGLTKKHIDVPELRSTLEFQPYNLALARTKTVQHQTGENVKSFLTPCMDFELSIVNITTGSRYVSSGPDILLVLDGSVQVASEGVRQDLRKGEQIFCSAVDSYKVTGSARFAKASVNPQNGFR